MKKRDEKEIVQQVQEDFKKRQQERKPFDAEWQLNMNFIMGNQYCDVGYNHEIQEFDKEFFWEHREVFNHIATITETRLAKLQNVRPTMTVVPVSNDETDVKTAKISKKILNSIYGKEDMEKLISDATKWSEVTGTAFYKVFWDTDKGCVAFKGDDGKSYKMGDVNIMVCSPFEIFPDSTTNENIEDCKSIIHAKPYHVDDIERIWGKRVVGEDINVFSLDNLTSGLGGLGFNGTATKVTNTKKENHSIVIEKYEKPSLENPNGKLIIVAGDTLLYEGELPYMNGIDGERGFPFIRQVCLKNAGCFWGGSVVQRIIPVQRAYNAVKNRKHEFLNRLSMGILTVEDGSVDIDNLEDEGLSPGKILVYRQGSNAPSFMSNTHVPTDFSAEEDRLLNEFKVISGVSDLMNASSTYANLSGVALQLLVEQDETRLASSSDQIKHSIKQISKHILRLYKQFAQLPRLHRIVGDHGELEIMYFSSSDITSDEVEFETDTKLNESLAQRRSMVFDLLNAGLLHDENGRLSNRMRIKALELLGFGVWENAQDINELHQKKASSENAKIINNEEVKVLEIDDHNLHIGEHISYMLGGEYEKKRTEKLEQEFLNHIREHKKFMSIEEDLKVNNND